MTDPVVRPAPDPERDARIEAYRDRERRRAARALDRYLELIAPVPPVGAAEPISVAGERFVEAVGDYVLARLHDETYRAAASDVLGIDLHQKTDYGVPTWESAHLDGQHADMWVEKCSLCLPENRPRSHAEGAHDV